MREGFPDWFEEQYPEPEHRPEDWDATPGIIRCLMPRLSPLTGPRLLRDDSRLARRLRGRVAVRAAMEALLCKPTP